ncbi:alanine--tRNA ligase AlaS [Thermoclostridium stercorarium subsp. stercorarium DSM 8532]|uniref:Alanine--tRNA ligase n=1 Tax=Thermoclostridium stercorarium (strain ATCC 35414 / DSM 8532 / NCIMB 11754) TaxID=1121335 RepID=L7VPL8_THES1|nr:alanine--tRNA ligase [Thermoclostridium stercorarium]AGC68391.1 alanine--tRNA ligase AlaS [Thermoclostridium stercorarium subsp. stercorarium DSM 8532]AGI39412.1 alanyl-tRNA synthetase [Thermoclostridium stercorarium subsp. stercorarium DSM 8532]
MQKFGLNELREKYLSFFESKGHLRLPSFSLVPENDPSVLLINAGMTPLKPYFTGQKIPPSRRVTTCQKCIRTPDIDNVGKTSRHATFFEMLGNFSFGDYFKKEAITWAWEFFTEVLGIPEERLYVSVYFEDDEAFDIWNKVVGLPKEKIFRMGKEDNFWEHGTGPCGPCSEIYFDRGKDKGCGKETCTVGCDCDRFIEVWNLVFSQFDRQEDGTYLPLKQKNIDTGMGLERLACVVQGVDNIFEVDTVRTVLDHVCRIAGVRYGEDYKKDVSIRVITDHIRGSSMLVSDGVLPSNEGRGYVLRRLIRRAARHGRLLGIKDAFLSELAETVINVSMGAYPHMDEKRDYIKKVISIEEEKFYNTIDQGMNILEEYVDELKRQGSDTISGSMVFKLHDTYGFPVDLTREIAQEHSMKIDENGFHEEMRKQKEKAREARLKKENSAWEKDLFSGGYKSVVTEFTGYNEYETEATVRFIVLDGKLVENAQMDDEVAVVLDRTPFYAESGGQVGDTGVITGDNFKMTVNDCKKTSDGKYLHYGKIESGMVQVNDRVIAKVDIERRKCTARNHTTTHILHRALKKILGDHVHQAGSLVAPDRLRFDFTHFSPLTEEQIEAVESEVNSVILSNYPVTVREMPLEEAKKAGATALFGEKYGDIVRVVSVGDYSMELCGGTHISSSGEAGLIKIIGESGIASGVRRIEALTGTGAISWYKNKERTLRKVAEIVKSTPDDTPFKVNNLVEEIKNLQKELNSIKDKLANQSVNDLLNKAEDVSGVKVLAARLDQLDMTALRNMADTLKNKLGASVVVLASGFDGKVSLVVSATKDAVSRGIHCGKIISEAAKAAGGGGGGRPDMAQAGGKDVNGIDNAVKIAVAKIKEQLG